MINYNPPLRDSPMHNPPFQNMMEGRGGGGGQGFPNYIFLM